MDASSIDRSSQSASDAPPSCGVGSRVFLGLYTLVLLVGLLLCVGLRLHHPLAWGWGQELMDSGLAWGGLGLLILTSLGAIWAARSARRARFRTAAVASLIAGSLALVCTAALLLDLREKACHGLLPAAAFQPDHRYLAGRHGISLPEQVASAPAPLVVAETAETPAVDSANIDPGRKLFLANCASCHGIYGEGMPGQGKDLNQNVFVQGTNEDSLTDFLRIGRPAWDAANLTKVAMPPRGGNPVASDEDLRSIAVYLLTLQQAGSAGGSMASLQPEDRALLAAAERSIVPAAAQGPCGFSTGFLAELHRPRWIPPSDGSTFANAFWLLVVLLVIQVAGLALGLGTLGVCTIRGRTDDACQTAYRQGAYASLAITFFGVLVFSLLYV